MRILVTGAAGFIGSHTCEKLLSEGHSVIGIDNFDDFYDIKLKESNLDLLRSFPKFSFLKLNLEDKADLLSVFPSDIDTVVHLAAKAGVRPSLKDPTAYVKANIEATVSLMEVMKEKEVKKLVFASSSSIYGKTNKIPFKEDQSFDQAISIYASSKQAGELFTRMYHNLYGLDVINLRFFTVYGPRQRPDLAIHKFLKANLLNEGITLFGDGSMSRDYTYVSDTCLGISGAIERVSNNSNVYETYNLGNSSPVSLKDLIHSIEKVTDKKCNTTYQDVPLGDVPVTYADISSAKKMLGYDPSVDLESGLKEMYKWIKEQY